MVVITPDEGPSGLTRSINALEEQLADMREELEELYRRIRAGDLSELKHATRATAEIRQWLKIAIEAEAQLEKRRQHERGIVHGYAIDFDAARVEIRCRMDRLRRARCAGRVPRCAHRG
jgi:GTP cyclohydrolase FolE2